MYTDVKEEALRKKVFLKNLQAINEHNAAFDRGESTFREGVNKWTDMTEEEFASRMRGIIMPNEIVKQEKKLRISLNIIFKIKQKIQM